MPETCPRRIVGESARTPLRDFGGELDLWTERGPAPRLFRALFRPWENSLWKNGEGEEERYDVDELWCFGIKVRWIIRWIISFIRTTRVGSFSSNRRIISRWRRFVEARHHYQKFSRVRETQCSFFFVSIILMAVKRTKLFESENSWLCENDTDREWYLFLSFFLSFFLFVTYSS